MANPITPFGRRPSRDIYEEASLQDEERQIREDDLHFRRTGENRRPRRLDSPLVDNNPSPDIANDGDSYGLEEDLSNMHGVGEYSEDNPTEFIGNLPSQNSRRQSTISNQLRDMLYNLPPPSRHSRISTIDAYNRREKEKQEKEFGELKEKRIEKSKNAILELQIEDEE